MIMNKYNQKPSDMFNKQDIFKFSQKDIFKIFRMIFQEKNNFGFGRSISKTCVRHMSDQIYTASDINIYYLLLPYKKLSLKTKSSRTSLPT